MTDWPLCLGNDHNARALDGCGTGSTEEEVPADDGIDDPLGTMEQESG